MIRKTASGYEVVSHTGKRLSKTNLSKKAAQRRLAVIEYYKKKGVKKA